KIKDGADGERIVYKVRSGDALSKIAARYHVSVASIKRWNNLSSNNIRIGQTLIIYRGGVAPASSGSSSSSSSTASASSSSSSGSSTIDPNAGYTVYTVKDGDSLYLIAKKYPGVSAQNIMDYNHISSSKIKPGMKLKIPKVK
ncbi:MAG: LysM peptidoglycan-binding domain-containing protein, partial [Bacteroidales bacterium]|nr:LysM peptidoglycan-binding domain-containing protein [Bacteroidales bacterium]